MYQRRLDGREWGGKIRESSRVFSMFRPKPKAYRVVLDGEIGGYSMMLVLGCADLDECIRHTNKTKDKGQKIFDIQEVV